MSSAKAPDVIPYPWKWTRFGPMTCAIREYPNGLVATHTVETYDDSDEAPLAIPGTYKRIVISRKGTDEYPGWDEMRDLIYECGIFDHSRDVFMLLPPKADYVNIRQNAFHFWQVVSA